MQSITISPAGMQSFPAGMPSIPTGTQNSTAPQSSRDIRDAVAAIVFREILKPLAEGLGPLGELAAGSVAERLFVARRR